MFRQRVGELMRERGLSYSKFSRATRIGMQRSKDLYENPLAQMNTTTLYRCSKFFNVPITELLVEDEQSCVA